MSGRRWKSVARVALCIVVVATITNCEKKAGTGTKVTLQLNWKPEPQFGGFYAADVYGGYRARGLDVTIVPGGAGAPTIDMVGAGTVPFAIVSGDELIKARANGNMAIALFAVYQTNPQGIMTHAERGFDDLSEIFFADGTLAMERGLPYATFLESKYGFGKLKLVPSPFGDLSVFRTDPNYSMQCFVTSEPLAAEALGLKAKTFLIADSGYNPYTTVMVTSQAYLQTNPQVVATMVQVVRAGWEAYLANPEPTNDVMRQLNPTMDAATFTASAAAQKPLIETDDTRRNGVGSMTAERWQTLADQLLAMKAIDKPVDSSQLYMRSPAPATAAK
jgi:NitT/TauT family transport system substrate-binding protein